MNGGKFQLEIESNQEWVAAFIQITELNILKIFIKIGLERELLGKTIIESNHYLQLNDRGVL